MHEEALQRGRYGDVIREPVGAATDLPKPVRAFGSDHLKGEVLDRKLDRVGRELCIEVRNDGRCHGVDLLQGAVDAGLNVALGNAQFKRIDLLAKPLNLDC